MGERRRRRTHVRAVEGRADAAQRVDVSGFGVKGISCSSRLSPLVGPGRIPSGYPIRHAQGDNPSLARREFIVLQVLQDRTYLY